MRAARERPHRRSAMAASVLIARRDDESRDDDGYREVRRRFVILRGGMHYGIVVECSRTERGGAYRRIYHVENGRTVDLA